MFCTSCGTENPPTGRFCTHCGAALPLPAGAGPVPVPIDATGVFSTAVLDDTDTDFSPAAHQGEIDALAPGSALLVVRRGPNAGSRFLLDRDVTTAGRHPDSDIFLDDVTVSRRHVEFRRDSSSGSSGFAVHDVGSLNGTYVNRERIDSSPLAGGDEVQIGKFRLVYLAPAGQSAPGSAPGVGAAS
ncbi:MAG: domain containing protein [Jatrophihabitantaceae bacterium]|nr:domain containing protein [Jatrophihabitantaceae bacterium]